MFTVIFILWGSATVGYLLRRHPIPGLERLMTYTVWGLLFLMGVEVGGNPTLMQALDRLGWEALILTLCTALGCALAAAALWSGSRRTIPATQTLTVEKDAGKGLLSHKHRLVALWHQLAGSFTIVAFFALGCALGVSHRIPSLPAEAGFYALCLLLICVGLTVGQSNEIRRSLRRIDKRLMWLPVLTIVGTWAGAVATACLLQGRSFTDWLAISSGFGYYSLSSILITEARNAEMGTVALIYNILRELMALLCAPLFRQFFGPLAPNQRRRSHNGGHHSSDNIPHERTDLHPPFHLSWPDDRLHRSVPRPVLLFIIAHKKPEAYFSNGNMPPVFI